MGNFTIKNAKIVDGTKQPAYYGDVYIVNDKINKIDLVGEVNSKQTVAIKDGVIDGSGLVLAPGFIDTHSHSDLEIILKPVLEPKIRQGITTEILGQDGVAMAPLPPEHIDNWRKNIAGLDGDSEELDWNYVTVGGYLQAIENSAANSNSAYLLPHGNIRMAVMGLADKQPSAEQLKLMKEMTRSAMEIGCLGLSTGLIYIPCAFARENELTELCKVVQEYNGTFVIHQRSEANDILDSMDEVIRIGLASGVNIHFSHFKICGKNNWNKLEQVLEKLEQAQAKGLRISFDMYPYTAGSTMLGVILPPWAHVGGTNRLLKRLQNIEIRKQIKEYLMQKNCKWDNFIEFAGLQGIIITSVKTAKNQELIGLNLEQLGELRKKDPLEATFDLLVEENNHVGMIDFYGNKDHIRTFIKRPEMNLCTDGLLGGKPHPRAFGSFPKLINNYVRQEKIITLEEAIYKMTYRAAQLFGLRDRGVIKEGAYADLVLFNEQTFADTSTYLEPVQYAKGLAMVMVNGQIVFDGVDYYKCSAGRLIRREGCS